MWKNKKVSNKERKEIRKYILLGNNVVYICRMNFSPVIWILYTQIHGECAVQHVFVQKLSITYITQKNISKYKSVQVP
jgi:hypothetical protein